MKMSIATRLTLIFLVSVTVFVPFAHSVDERNVLSREYVGLGVGVYAPYQCYPGEVATLRIRIEALEDLENVSATVYIWSSKSDGYAPWGVSFEVLDIKNLSRGAIRDTRHDVEVPIDISPGLMYGILFLDWSALTISSWESHWDKASFRATYVKDVDYENLALAYDSTLVDLQNHKILAYVLLTTTVISLVSVYFARRRSESVSR